MNFLVDVYDEENRDDTEKYVLFHNYKDAASFENEFMDMSDELVGHYDNCWLTNIVFDNSFGTETISEEEFKDWFNNYIDTDLKKKQEVKCSL